MNKVLEIKRTIKGSIAPNNNVTFEAASPYSDGITYDNVTGEITLPEIGQYIVRWWVSTDTALSGSIQFALKSTQGDAVIGCSPTKQGQLIGFADIYAKTDNVRLSLVNTGEHNVYLSKSSPVTAALLATLVPGSGDGISGTVIPFSIGKYGLSMSTDVLGNPEMVFFSGFGASINEGTPIQPTEWTAGIIDASAIYGFNVTFVMPHNATLKKLHFIASSENDDMFTGRLRVFACVAISTSGVPVFNILGNSITYSEVFEPGTIYPRHTVRKGVSPDLDIAIPEGALVGIVVGLAGEDMTAKQYAQFSVNGGIYLE